MAVEPSPLFTLIPEIVGVPALFETFLFSSIMLSSTDSVVVFNIVSFPSTVKSPCTLTPASVTVISVLPDAVTMNDVEFTVAFVVPDVIAVVDTAPTSASTYALTDCCVGTFVALFEDMLSSSTIAVPLILVFITGEVSVLLVIVCVPASLYALVTTSPSSDGAPVARPVILLVDALMTTSPTDIPLCTLKFLVVMVPFLPHDCYFLKD